MNIDLQRLITLSSKIDDIKDLGENNKYVNSRIFGQILTLQANILDTIINYKTIKTTPKAEDSVFWQSAPYGIP